VGTGKQASVKLEETSALSKDEIDRMKKDAEEHAEEDRRQFELAEAKNKGEHLIYQIEKDMRENAEKLSDADRAPLQAAIEKVRNAIKGDAAEAIKSATTELEQAYQGFSKTLYEKTAAAGGQASPASAEAPKGVDDDAIDAEFEVK
jgi:molecular chaperone DnaK